MARVLGRCISAGLVVLSATACHSAGKGAGVSAGRSSSGAVPASSSGGPGEGSASVTIGSIHRTFTVTCIRGAGTTQATGNEGSDAVTLTVAGNPTSVVLVSHFSDGSTTIYQAIRGLRDDNGQVAGAISVSATGNHFSGTGSFVLTRIDNKGLRVKSSGSASESGQFTLSCDSGYAAAPTTAAPSASASASRSR